MKEKKTKTNRIISEITFVSDIPDVPDALDVADVADIPDISDIRDVPDAGDIFFFHDFSDDPIPDGVAADFPIADDGATNDRAPDDRTADDNAAGGSTAGSSEWRIAAGLIIRENRIRLILIGVGLLLFAIYKFLSLSGDTSAAIYSRVIKPFHGFLASALDHTQVCVAEVLIIALFVVIILYTIIKIVDIIYPIRLLLAHIRDLFVMIFIPYGRPVSDQVRALEMSHRLGGSVTGKGPYRAASHLIAVLLTFCMTISLVYGGFSILWGFYYTAPGVSERLGIAVDGVAHEELLKTDRYFLELANEYSDLVARSAVSEDHPAVFVMTESSFSHSYDLYKKVGEKYPALLDEPHRPKLVRASKLVSLMDFTGFFFPFTGEACINSDSPDCMRPAVVAHELAHQRGIAAEDEANFIGILACLEDGDPDYVYSASLMALIYLQNAVRKSGDSEAWQEIRDSYAPGVEADIEYNSEYWQRYRGTPVNRVTTGTYDAFLKSYDQKLGRETYGACVDYLVYYYGKNLP